MENVQFREERSAPSRVHRELFILKEISAKMRNLTLFTTKAGQVP